MTGSIRTLMSKDQEPRFSDLVKTRLSPQEEDARTLWVPLAEDYERAGPDAVRVYLAAEQQRLVERVQVLLDEIEGEIDG